jgi:hypothetical protein
MRIDDGVDFGREAASGTAHQLFFVTCNAGSVLMRRLSNNVVSPDNLTALRQLGVVPTPRTE